MYYYELFEEENYFEKLYNFLLLLREKCSNIIEIYDERPYFLYRGIKGVDSIVTPEPPKNRKPKDSNINLQTLIDNWLNDNGYSVLRSNSYFCTSNYNIAKYYGQPYLVFPENGFDYLWFENSPDLHETIDKFYHRLKKKISYTKDIKSLKNDFNALLLSNNNFIDIEQTVDEFMNFLKPKQNDLIMALEKNNEIMLTGKYHAIKYESLPRIISKNIVELLTIDEKDLRETLYIY